MGVPLEYLFAAIRSRHEREIYRGKTDFYEARVVDNEKTGERRLFLDVQLASGMTLPGGALLFKYTHMARLAYLSMPTLSSALFIGMGGGTEIRHLLLSRPDTQVDIVEPDRGMPKIARDYFRFPSHDQRIRIHATDGLKFLSNLPAKKKYDFLRLDAFDFGTKIPRHLLASDAIRLMRAHLASQGILAANIVSPLAGEGNDAFLAARDAFVRTFPHVTILTTKKETPEVQQNIALLASLKRPLTREVLEDAAGMDAHLSEIVHDCLWSQG